MQITLNMVMALGKDEELGLTAEEDMLDVRYKNRKN